MTAPQHKTNRGLLYGLGLIWVGYLFLLAQFMTASTDESAYFYQAFMLSEGHLPVLDFFSMHLPWFYIPYAAVMKLLNSHLETLRLFNMVVVMGGMALVGRMVHREHGLFPSLIAVMIIGLSWSWMSNNLEVRHSTICNFTMLATLYFLSKPQPYGRLDALAIGALASLTINARAVLLTWGIIVLVCFVYRLVKEQRAEWKALLGLAVLAALIVAAPSLALLAADPTAFLYNTLGARLEWSAGQTGMAEMEGETGSIFEALYLQFTLGSYSNLIIPVFIAVLAGFASFGKQAVLQTLKRHRLIVTTLVFMLGIVLSYAPADRVPKVYLHHNIAFFAVLIGCALGVLLEKVQNQKPLKALSLVLMSLYALSFVGLSLPEIWLRGHPFHKRPVESGRMACWLEQHTKPEDRIFAAYPTPLASAGRFTAAGLEQGVGIFGFFWPRYDGSPDFPEDKAERFKILTAPTALQQFKDEVYPVILTNGMLDKRLNERYLDQLHQILEAQYQHITWPDRENSFSVYIPKTADLESYQSYPLQPYYRDKYQGLIGEKLRDRDFGGAIGVALSDVGESLSLLPADLGKVFARITGRDFQARCGSAG